jgi:hypothetical protein
MWRMSMSWDTRFGNMLIMFQNLSDLLMHPCSLLSLSYFSVTKW